MCTQETNRVHEKLPIIFGGPGPLAVRRTGEKTLMRREGALMSCLQLRCATWPQMPVKVKGKFGIIFKGWNNPGRNCILGNGTRPISVPKNWLLHTIFFHPRYGRLKSKDDSRRTCCLGKRICIGTTPGPPSNSHHQDYYIFSRESL